MLVIALAASPAFAQPAIRYDDDMTFGWPYAYVSFGAPVGEGVTQWDAYRLSGRVPRSKGVNHGSAVRLVLECPASLPCAIVEQRAVVELAPTGEHAEVQGHTIYPPVIVGTNFRRSYTLKLVGDPTAGLDGNNYSFALYNLGRTRLDDDLYLFEGARLLAGPAGCELPGISFYDGGGNGMAHLGSPGFQLCAAGERAARVLNTGLVVDKRVTAKDVVLTDDDGVLMKAPDGGCWRLSVQANGSLLTSSTSCP